MKLVKECIHQAILEGSGLDIIQVHILIFTYGHTLPKILGVEGHGGTGEDSPEVVVKKHVESLQAHNPFSFFTPVLFDI